MRNEAHTLEKNESLLSDGFSNSSFGTMYQISEETFFVSLDGGKSWVNRYNNLPLRVVYPFDSEAHLPVHDIGIDSNKPWRLLLCSRNSIFISANFGSTWKRLDTEKYINENTYFTAASLSSVNSKAIIAGTSFEGIYESLDGGKTWVHVSKGMEPIDQGAGFDDEISGIAYEPGKTDVIYFSLGFGNGLFKWQRKEGTVIPIQEPKKDFNIQSIRFWRYPFVKNGSNHPLKDRSTITGKWYLEVYTGEELWILDMNTMEWLKMGTIRIDNSVAIEEKTSKAASNREGIYIPATLANKKHMPNYLKYIKENNLDSIIVDLKDDFGKLTYKTGLKIPLSIGAVNSLVDLDYLINWCKNNDIYLIARVVVFKDKMLFSYKNWKYTLLDKSTNRPWAFYRSYIDEETGEKKTYQSEYWVDPYSEFVWDYNIDIAEELQQKGVDEIQFDYIRFPSDGEVARISSRYKKTGMQKVDALSSFLRKANERINIPISADVYGFNAWAKMGYLGQDIIELSNYADVICPMYYPSHFPIHFLPQMDYIEKAETIYREGTFRAHLMTNGRSYIRPYVQSFLIGPHEDFDKTTASLYFHNQILGIMRGKGSGFSLWNAAGKYNMNSESLASFTQNTF